MLLGSFARIVFYSGLAISSGACAGAITGEEPQGASSSRPAGPSVQTGRPGADPAVRPGGAQSETGAPNGSAGSPGLGPDGKTLPGTGPVAVPSAQLPPVGPATASGGLRLLSRTEYDNTVSDLLGDRSRPGTSKLPEPRLTPDVAFENDISLQDVSGPLIAAAESLSQEIAERSVQNPVTRKALLTCSPSGPGDVVCMKTFIKAFGRRAFRRPLTDVEVAAYASLQSFAVEQNDFFVGVEMVVRGMLQDPNFLYRVEIGSAVAGSSALFKLDSFEMASRLSYFLRGGPPGEALSALADANKLATPEDISAAAVALFADPMVRTRVRDFHAEWLSYKTLPHPTALASAMLAETNALIDRVVFDKASAYEDLFLSKDTFIDGVLAKQYGLTVAAGAKPAWVPYGMAPRLGILSHGTVLSATNDLSDTHPVRRGRFISTRLMCRPVPPPPESLKDAIAKAPMGSSPCKIAKATTHMTEPVCAGCHVQMDPIGFGLESYDREGKFRTTEPAPLTQCQITGQGKLPEIGDFKGADGLATALVGAGRVQDCAVQEVFRFAMGRQESDPELAELKPIMDGVRTRKAGFRDILLGVAAAKSFGFRFDDSGKGN